MGEGLGLTVRRFVTRGTYAGDDRVQRWDRKKKHPRQ